MLAVTGILLSIYYIPSEGEAYKSIIKINEEVTLGWLIRSTHKWSAHLLIVFIMLHTIRVFVIRRHTGQQLLAHQWQEQCRSLVIHFYILYIIRGGAEVNGVTLIRFYSIHVLWIPFSMCIILWAHFHMVKKQGISRGL
ncbi:MAG: DUF4405 domain-containing protein [Nitrospirota bacterium]